MQQTRRARPGSAGTLAKSLKLCIISSRIPFLDLCDPALVQDEHPHQGFLFYVTESATKGPSGTHNMPGYTRKPSYSPCHHGEFSCLTHCPCMKIGSSIRKNGTRSIRQDVFVKQLACSSWSLGFETKGPQEPQEAAVSIRPYSTT